MVKSGSIVNYVNSFIMKFLLMTISSINASSFLIITIVTRDRERNKLNNLYSLN